jgi:hypothetical protein
MAHKYLDLAELKACIYTHGQSGSVQQLKGIEMAWNTLTYACGHTEQVQLYGRHSGRERTIAAALGHDCPACRAAKAQAAAAESGLVARLILAVDAMIAKAHANFAALPAEKQPAMAAQLAGLEAAAKKAKSQARAGWWIDQKNHDGRTLLLAIVAGQA